MRESDHLRRRPTRVFEPKEKRLAGRPRVGFPGDCDGPSAQAEAGEIARCDGFKIEWKPDR